LGTEVDRSYLKQAKKIHLNNTAAELMQLASVYNEGTLTVDGSFSVDTGKHTGRSPKDKHIIADEATLDNVWWENNAKIERDKFNLLENDMLGHMNGKNLFIQDLYAGTDPKEKIKVKIITEFAWQALFIQHLLYYQQDQNKKTLKRIF
jgi:phosphoenolpyruvate carboxykinase (ATP)